MPTATLDRTSRSTSSYISSQTDDSDSNSMDTESMSSYKRSFLPSGSSSSQHTPDSFSPSAVLMSMASTTRSSYPSYSISASTSPFQGYTHSGAPFTHSLSHSPSPALTPTAFPSSSSSTHWYRTNALFESQGLKKTGMETGIRKET